MSIEIRDQNPADRCIPQEIKRLSNPKDSNLVSESIISDADSARSRAYVGILFECCGIYQRIYRRDTQSEYRGRCPRCLRPVRLKVGPHGTSTRIFRAN